MQSIDSILPKSIALVVDDHPETLRLLIDALESANVTVLVATDGRRALEQIDRLMPDLILLDAMMPGMDGFETCRALKSGPAPDVPVIFMTGLDETEHVVRGLEAGGIDYLTKPIAPDELLARIRVHLANARSALGARAALDVSGRTMLAAGAGGAVRWATPQARELLVRLRAGAADAAMGEAPARTPQLPPEVQAWVRAAAASATEPPPDAIIVSAGAMRIRFRFLSRVSDDEVLLVLQQAAASEVERDGVGKLQKRFYLTAREAEVLYWLSCGKANRDIAEILGMSPRTVNKHLEHVYRKVGVESRAAAVSIAVGSLRT